MLLLKAGLTTAANVAGTNCCKVTPTVGQLYCLLSVTMVVESNDPSGLFTICTKLNPPLVLLNVKLNGDWLDPVGVAVPAS